MNNISEVSHSQLVMWVVGFFFTGMGAYSLIFWGSIRGLKKMAKNISSDVVSVKKELQDIDKRKVELILYVEDKEKAETLLKTLQTTEKCTLMQSACIGSLRPRLDNILEDLKTVIEGQKELTGIGEALDVVRERQKQIIDRIDTHLSNHGHEGGAGYRGRWGK